MDLIIVESPTKAKTLSRFLGEGVHVLASMGHIRDLPEKKLGIDVKHDFALTYEIPIKKIDKVKELQDEAKKADKIILATDPDREGEAIAWHIAT
jgi:DNA topoisomerase-1